MEKEYKEYPIGSMGAKLIKTKQLLSTPAYSQATLHAFFCTPTRSGWEASVEHSMPCRLQVTLCRRNLIIVCMFTYICIPNHLQFVHFVRNSVLLLQFYLLIYLFIYSNFVNSSFFLTTSAPSLKWLFFFIPLSEWVLILSSMQSKIYKHS